MEEEAWPSAQALTSWAKSLTTGPSIRRSTLTVEPHSRETAFAVASAPAAAVITASTVTAATPIVAAAAVVAAARRGATGRSGVTAGRVSHGSRSLLRHHAVLPLYVL